MKNKSMKFVFLDCYFLCQYILDRSESVKDLNIINEIKNLNLLRFNFPSKSA